MTEKEIQIKFIEAQMVERQMWFQYWIAQATTGVAANRRMLRGDKELTREELIEEALKTAKQHILLYTELNEARDDLLRDKKLMG